MHMTQSALPSATVDAVRAVDGVAWAEGLRYTTSIVESDRRPTVDDLRVRLRHDDRPRRAPAPRGRPASRARRGARRRHRRRRARHRGRRRRLDPRCARAPSGQWAVHDGTNIVNTTVFIRTEDFARLRGDTFAYVLAGAEPDVDADTLAQRLAAALPDTTVQTRAEFARQEANVVRDMAADVMKIVTVIGFLIALAVIGLTLFTATLAKLREYGILKALGAGSGRLAVTVAAQAAWSVALGLAVAVATSVLLGAAIGARPPTSRSPSRPASVIRTGAGALLVGAVAALLPLRRVLRVDPATAFRRP